MTTSLIKSNSTPNQLINFINIKNTFIGIDKVVPETEYALMRSHQYNLNNTLFDHLINDLSDEKNENIKKVQVEIILINYLDKCLKKMEYLYSKTLISETDQKVLDLLIQIKYKNTFPVVFDPNIKSKDRSKTIPILLAKLGFVKSLEFFLNNFDYVPVSDDDFYDQKSIDLIIKYSERHYYPWKSLYEKYKELSAKFLPKYMNVK